MPNNRDFGFHVTSHIEDKEENPYNIDANNNDWKNFTILTFPDDMGFDDPNSEYTEFIKFGIRQSKASKFLPKKTGRPDQLNRNTEAERLRIRQTVKTSKEINLMMPASISINNSVQWENQELGVAGGVDFSKVVSGLKNVLGGNFGSARDDASQFFNQFGKEISPVLKEAALKTAGTFTGLEILNRSELVNRRLRNHNLSVLFKGIGFRNFQLSFKFAPRSERETLIARGIIQAFKFHSAPELRSDSGSGNWFTYPDEFTIDFMRKRGNFIEENPFVPALGICVCNSVEANYTPEGLWAAFKNGAPVVVDLNLNFTETELVTKERILNDNF